MTSLLQTGLNGHLPAPPEKRFLISEAGIDYVVLGIESLEDDVVISVRKNNPFELSRNAVQLLRKYSIVSFANLIYGLVHL